VLVGVSDERGYPGDKGVVEVTFQLAEGKFVVISAHYDPDREHEW
jgi:hypothetical protein